MGRMGRTICDGRASSVYRAGLPGFVYVGDGLGGGGGFVGHTSRTASDRKLRVYSWIFGGGTSPDFTCVT